MLLNGVGYNKPRNEEPKHMLQVIVLSNGHIDIAPSRELFMHIFLVA